MSEQALQEVLVEAASGCWQLPGLQVQDHSPSEDPHPSLASSGLLQPHPSAQLKWADPSLPSGPRWVGCQPPVSIPRAYLG